MLANGIPSNLKDVLVRILDYNANTLRLRTEKLHHIIGGPISVLPPDVRHADYDVIPLIIADGCLYHCDFCCIKSHRRFRKRSEANIGRQIRALKTFYGENLSNYNALFLGNHDALAAGQELICAAATVAYEMLGFENCFMKNPTLYLFGSVDSLLWG